MGPITIFDKSALQAVSANEAVCLNRLGFGAGLYVVLRGTAKSVPNWPLKNGGDAREVLLVP